MGMPKKEGVEAVGLRLHRDAAHKLKIVAAQRRTTFSAIVQEALVMWWAQQPESKKEGSLFPDEVESSPETTSKSEQSPPKEAGDKATPKKAPNSTGPKKPAKK